MADPNGQVRMDAPTHNDDRDPGHTNDLETCFTFES